MATMCSTPTEALYIFSGSFMRVGLVLLSQRNRLPALKALERILMIGILRIIIKYPINTITFGLSRPTLRQGLGIAESYLKLQRYL